MRVNHVLRLLGLFALVFASGLFEAAPPAAAQERVCYKLVITTVLDWLEGQGQDWHKAHTFTREPDGSIKAHSDGAVWGYWQDDFWDWQVWPDKGKAVHNYRAPDGRTGSSEVTWTVPPQVWCSDQDVTLSITATSTKNTAGTGRFGTSPVEMFQPGEKCQVQSVFGGVGAGDWSTGLEPSDSGSCSGLRPKAIAEIKWTLWIYLTGAYPDEFWVFYGYEPIPPGEETPTPGEPSPTPGGQEPTPAGQEPTPGGQQPTAGGLLPTPPYGQPEPNSNVLGMTLQAGQRRIVAGQTALVPVWLIKANNVANLNYDVTYDANVARPEGTIQRGSLMENTLLSTNPDESGIVRVGFARTAGLSGTGTVVYIPFRAVGKVGDRTPLTLAVTAINDPSGGVPAIDRIHGEIVIVGPEGLVPGDCEGDGRLTESDALCALEMSVQLKPPRSVLDIDANGEVTSRDATLILQRAIGLIR